MTRRIDATGFGDLKIIQDPDAFCYGVDAVLLAGFAADILSCGGKVPGRLMDIGTGNGIIPLILAHKTEIPELFGIDFQEHNIRLAGETAALNGLDGRMQFIHEDVAELLDGSEGEEDGPGGLCLKGTFDAVTSNPPYTKRQGGAVSLASAKALARHETTADLAMFLELAARLLREKGDLFLVHRPQRLVDLLTFGRQHRLEAKDLQLVSGHPGEKPNIVLVHMVKGGGAELHVLPQISVREADGQYTADLLRIYEREGGV